MRKDANKSPPLTADLHLSHLGGELLESLLELLVGLLEVVVAVELQLVLRRGDAVARRAAVVRALVVAVARLEAAVPTATTAEGVAQAILLPSGLARTALAQRLERKARMVTIAGRIALLLRAVATCARCTVRSVELLLVGRIGARG